MKKKRVFPHPFSLQLFGCCCISLALASGFLVFCTTMPTSKIYPISPAKRHNIALHYHIHSTLLSASGVLPIAAHKKLKRMPHIFSRVLELPCDADTLVDVEEKQDGFVFVIEQPGLVVGEVRAEAVEIVPGAVKVVIHGSAAIRAALQELEVDLWRFRLPSCTLPEASSAAYVNGVLTVIVPKMSSSPSTEIRLEKVVVGSEAKDFSKKGDTYEIIEPASDGSDVVHECGDGTNKDVNYSFGDSIQSATCTIDFVKNLMEAIVRLLVGRTLLDGASPIFSSLLKVDLLSSLSEGGSTWGWLAASQ